MKERREKSLKSSILLNRIFTVLNSPVLYFSLDLEVTITHYKHFLSKKGRVFWNWGSVHYILYFYVSCPLLFGPFSVYPFIFGHLNILPFYFRPISCHRSKYLFIHIMKTKTDDTINDYKGLLFSPTLLP